MTFIECEGTGRYSDEEKQNLNSKYPFVNANKIVKIEMLATDEHVKKIIDIIRENGRTGFKGDGIIIISEVDEVYKVRTDEIGILAV